MCDVQTATALMIKDGGKRGMDIDKESVQAIAIVGGVIISVTALIVDGEIGYAVATGMLSMGSAVVGYLFGKHGGTEDEAKEI